MPNPIREWIAQKETPPPRTNPIRQWIQERETPDPWKRIATDIVKSRVDPRGIGDLARAIFTPDVATRTMQAAGLASPEYPTLGAEFKARYKVDSPYLGEWPQFAHYLATDVAGEALDVGTSPFTYTIPPLVKAAAPAIGRIPIGKTTVGRIMTTPLGPRFGRDIGTMIREGIMPSPPQPSIGGAARLDPRIKEQMLRERAIVPEMPIAEAEALYPPTGQPLMLRREAMPPAMAPPPIVRKIAEPPAGELVPPEKPTLPQVPAEEGKVTVYYRTNIPVEKIREKGFKSLENTDEIFVSNQKMGQAEGYGKNIIELKVDPKHLRLDDEFPSGEQHFAIKKDIADKTLSLIPAAPASTELPAPPMAPSPPAAKKTVSVNELRQLQSDYQEIITSYKDYIKDFYETIKYGKGQGLRLIGEGKKVRIGLPSEVKLASGAVPKSERQWLQLAKEKLRRREAQADFQEDYDATREAFTIASKKEILREEYPKLEAYFARTPKVPRGKIKELVRKTTGQVKPSGKMIREELALKRSLERQALAAREAKWAEKKRVTEMQRLTRGIQRLPIEGMNYEEKAKLETLKQELKTTRTLEGLRNLFGRMQELKEIGKQKYIEVKGARQARFDAEKDLLIKTIQTGTPTKPPVPRVYTTLPPPAPVKIVQAHLLRTPRLLDSLDGGQNFKGPHHQILYDKVDEATNLKLNNLDKYNNAGVELLKRNGLTPRRLSEVRDIKGVKLMLDEIMHIYAVLNNTENLRAIVMGNKISLPVIQGALESLTPSEKAAADSIVRELNESYPRTREAFLEFTDGKTDLGKVEGNYVPMLRQSEFYETSDQELLKELAERQGLKKAYAERGFTKGRVKIPEAFQKPIRLGLTKIYFEHVAKREHFIALGNIVKDMQRLVNDRDWTQVVSDKFGKDYLEAIRNYVNRIGNPNIYKQFNTAEKAISVARKNSAIVYLGYNLLTMGKQFPSFFLFLGEVSPAELFGGISELTSDYANKVKFIQDRDPQMKHRAIERELEEFKQTSPAQYRRIIQKTGEIGMQGIYFIDQVATHAGWLGKYNEMIKAGASEAEAIAAARKAVLRTQPAADPKDIASIYASAEWLNVFTQFSNQLNQIYNMITYDIPMRARTGRQKDAMLGGLGVILSAWGIWVLSHGRIPTTWDDVKDFLLNQIEYLTFAGPIINAARKRFGGLPPALRGLAAVGEFVGAAEKGKPGRMLEKGLEVGAFATRVPFAQPRRTIRGAIDIMRGETADPRRLLWSPSMLEEKKKKEKSIIPKIGSIGKIKPIRGF